jgi:hypothetical protein
MLKGTLYIICNDCHIGFETGEEKVSNILFIFFFLSYYQQVPLEVMDQIKVEFLDCHGEICAIFQKL